MRQRRPTSACWSEAWSLLVGCSLPFIASPTSRSTRRLRWLASNTSVENTSSAARGCSTVSPRAERRREPIEIQVDAVGIDAAQLRGRIDVDLVRIANVRELGARLDALSRVDGVCSRGISTVGADSGGSTAVLISSCGASRSAMNEASSSRSSSVRSRSRGCLRRFFHHAPRALVETRDHGRRIGRMIGFLERRDADRPTARRSLPDDRDAARDRRSTLRPSGRPRAAAFSAGARISVVLSAGDSVVGASAKFIISASTVGSSRGGISRVGDSSAPRSGVSSVKSRSELACSCGDSPVAAVSSFSLRAVIEAAALALRLAEQIDVDAVLAALEVEIDQGAGAAAAAGGRGE